MISNKTKQKRREPQLLRLGAGLGKGFPRDRAAARSYPLHILSYLHPPAVVFHRRRGFSSFIRHLPMVGFPPPHPLIFLTAVCSQRVVIFFCYFFLNYYFVKKKRQKGGGEQPHVPCQRGLPVVRTQWWGRGLSGGVGRWGAELGGETLQSWLGGGRKVGVGSQGGHHVSGSWLMSVRLVSFRMALMRSKESAWRMRSNCTWNRTVPTSVDFFENY